MEGLVHLETKLFGRFLWNVEGDVHGINFGHIFNKMTIVLVSTNSYNPHVAKCCTINVVEDCVVNF